MSDIAILKEMIKDNAIVTLAEQLYGKRLHYSVVLTEPNDNYSVTINGMPKHDQVIIIKADNFAAPKDVFNGSKGECKRADFIIITNTGIEKFILCIELKKTKDSKKTIIQQLTGSQCFVEYIREIGKNFWKKHNFLESYQYRFVSIGYISISKQTTRINRTATLHNRPEIMLKISSPYKLQFDHLI